MLKNESLKKYIDELIDEVQKELDESNVTGNVDGYQTPNVFSGKNSKERRKKTATQLGYSIVDNDVENIDESIFELDKREGVNEALDPKAEKFLDAIQVNDRSIKDLKNITVDATPQGNWSVYYKGKRMFTLNGKMLDDKTIMKYGLEHMDESLSEGKKIQRPVNRWLELKNDESMHANKKLATGLRELKYQLKEVETFFRWYNQIKTMNELSSDTFWKRTHGHIYKIKERLINIAKTIQEIEK